MSYCLHTSVPHTTVHHISHVRVHTTLQQKRGKHRARGGEGRRLTLIKDTDTLCKRCNSKQFPVQPLTDMQTVDSRFKILNLIRNPPKVDQMPQSITTCCHFRGPVLLNGTECCYMDSPKACLLDRLSPVPPSTHTNSILYQHCFCTGPATEYKDHYQASIP